MRKSPVLFSLGVTFVIWIAAFLYFNLTTRNPDELAFTSAFMFVIFPFVWFAVWLIVNAAAWWQEATGRSQEDDEAPQGSGDADAGRKKPHRLRGS
jgi:hypothetical protein